MQNTSSENVIMVVFVFYQSSLVDVAESIAV